ncbi:MAG: DUF5659 domain-containing protein [Candidatus Hodarchaeota archaeon]
MNTNETFETTDLYLASAMKLKGISLIRIKKIGVRGIFVFKDFDGRPEFIRKYFNGELEGSLGGFANAWSDLKAMIYAL